MLPIQGPEEKQITIKEYALLGPRHAQRYTQGYVHSRLALPASDDEIQSVITHDDQIYVCIECEVVDGNLCDGWKTDYEFYIIRTDAVVTVKTKSLTFLGTVWFELHNCHYHVYYRQLECECK